MKLKKKKLKRNISSPTSEIVSKRSTLQKTLTVGVGPWLSGKKLALVLVGRKFETDSSQFSEEILDKEF